MSSVLHFFSEKSFKSLIPTEFFQLKVLAVISTESPRLVSFYKFFNLTLQPNSEAPFCLSFFSNIVFNRLKQFDEKNC